MTAIPSRALTLAGLFWLAGTATALAADPRGVWIDHTGRGAVEITECGNRLCGRIVWVKSKGHAEGCNVQVIGNARPVGGGKWDGGWILDPEENRKYDVELTPLGRDRMRVLGYLGIKMFGETMTWRRAPGDLERCDKAKPKATNASAPPPPAPTSPPSAPLAAAQVASPPAASPPAAPGRAIPTSAGSASAPAPGPASPPAPAAREEARAPSPPEPAGATAQAPAGPQERAPAGAVETSPPPVAAAPEPEPRSSGSRRGGPERALVEALGSLFEEKERSGGSRECKVRIPDFATLSFPC
jgi:uncharacterized protein (DUF2147 family)